MLGLARSLSACSVYRFQKNSHFPNLLYVAQILRLFWANLVNFAVVVRDVCIYVSRSFINNQGKVASMACMWGACTLVHGNMHCSYWINETIHIIDSEGSPWISFDQLYRNIHPSLWHFCWSFCCSCPICVIHYIYSFLSDLCELFFIQCAILLIELML